VVVSKETIFEGSWVHLFRRHSNYNGAPNLVEMELGHWSMIEVTEEMDKRAKARDEMCRVIDEVIKELQLARVALYKEVEEGSA
jgi:hypothetical protein